MPGVEAALRSLETGEIISHTSYEQGELLLKSPAIFDRYLNKPDSTAKKLIGDGWYATGDVASRNSEGSYKIVGRNEDIDNTRAQKGGYKLTAN
jgi:long-subunit acyl-CoA synthetase (AMP-forming)